MTWEEQLVKAYTDSRERLIKTIERRLRWGQSAAQERALLDLVDKELARLNAVTQSWTQAAVQQSFLAGVSSAYRIISPNTEMPSYSAFMGTHKRAIEILVHNTQEFLNITNNLIARQAVDVIRDMGVLTTTHKFGENLTWQQMDKEMQKTLLGENFYTVPWRNGRGHMRVDSYANLVARTTTAEATNTGTINQMEEMGEYLVKMTAHNTTCKVCAPRQGRVYRLKEFPPGDERNQFPHISLGMPRWPTYKTIHVNCRHRVLPYVWSQKSQGDKDAALGKAGKPFDTDPRSEAEMKRYDDAQRKQAERLRDRKEWEKIKAVLPDDAPSFSGYRAMKAAESERYQDLKSDYRYALKVMRKDDILQSKFFNKLPIEGKPFGLKDLVLEDGTVKQRRLYGEDGRPVKDLDISDHGNRKRHPTVPHAHDWQNGIRDSEGRPWTEKEKRQNKDLLGGDEDV